MNEIWALALLRVHVKKFEGHQTGLETKEVSSDLLAPLLLLSRYSGVGDFTKWLDQPWDEDPLFFLRSYTMCSHISFLVLYCSRKEEAGGFRPRPRPQSLTVQLSILKLYYCIFSPWVCMLMQRLRGLFNTPEIGSPCILGSSYVKKSNNAEAVEAASAVCGGGGRRSVNDTQNMKKEACCLFLPFFKAALLSKLYIVNKQLTQAKEAKNTSLHFLDAEKINQCNPILGQR